MRNYLRLWAFALLLLCVPVATPEAQEEADVETSSFDEIKERVIIGRLGKQFGSMTRIEGYWEFDRHREPKGSWLYFVVVTVDGKQLGATQRFRRSDLRFASDELRLRLVTPFETHPIQDDLLFHRITLEVYESIEHRGEPAAYREATGMRLGPGMIPFELVAIVNCANGELEKWQTPVAP